MTSTSLTPEEAVMKTAPHKNPITCGNSERLLVRLYSDRTRRVVQVFSLKATSDPGVATLGSKDICNSSIADLDFGLSLRETKRHEVIGLTLP